MINGSVFEMRTLPARLTVERAQSG
ncbi:hypothetical protein IL54_1499 [Sphingobium sp. ba1]|nr:hypothetical protein IL54_1499 [Sphingobium sp. ba1]